MNTSLLKHFPASFTPNQQQLDLINGIENAFKDGYKFVICCAPTGTGKSFISKTLLDATDNPDPSFVEMVNDYSIYKQTIDTGYVKEEECEELDKFGGFVLTITKALQDQYSNLFNDIKILKGKSNYTCAIDDQFTVDVAPCVHVKSIREGCWKENKCPYYNARNVALTNKFTALNYDMFFALPNHTKQREALVCDEASELEDVFVKEFSCIVNLPLLRSCKISIPTVYVDNYSKMKHWVHELATLVFDAAKNIEKSFNKSVATKAQEMEKQKAVQLKNLWNSLNTLSDTWSESEYIIEKTATDVTFTPLKINKLTNRLFKFADKVILMSATIIDHKSFAKTLGITNYKYIEVESSFDHKKSPIYISSKHRLNSKNLFDKLPAILKDIEQICNHHKNDKGIIHSHSNEITKFLQINLKGDRYLFREPGVKNEDILYKHSENDDPTILISPSMTHGVDLKGDLAKFQIIIKAPFLPLQNNRIKILFDSDKIWYETRMLSTFIQACGRGTRSKKDTCTTYVLDGNIGNAVIRNKDKIPKHVLSRFV